jgi:hypothetical protein
MRNVAVKSCGVGACSRATRGVCIRTSTRHGGTLIEMLITFVLLGIIASVVTPATRRFSPPDPSDPMTVIGDTITSVVASGKPATLEFLVNGRRAIATINPDGSVIADTVLHIERFTGRSVRAR